MHDPILPFLPHSQPSFPPGQPASVVYANPPPPQMNPTPQPRQVGPPKHTTTQPPSHPPDPYYPNRGSLSPGSGPRGVPPSNAPRSVTPTHVYQPGPGSQMMMISGQQLPFTNTPQGPAYFIPGQYRPTAYVTTAQQYPVPPGTPGFYPGTNPAEYGKNISLTWASGAYYPAQAQFPPPVQAGPVIMNPVPQQQQPPPQPPQHIPTKRERKQIRIRDPNQGGRDITEEIMSGGRSGSTPTPPQVSYDAFIPKPPPPPPSCTAELSVVLPPSPLETPLEAPLEAPLESPIAQPEELRLPNGLPLPAPQDPEAPAMVETERDDSPIAEPEPSHQPIIKDSVAVTQAAPPPVVQTTPELVDQPTPPPAVEEIPVEPVQAAPTQNTEQIEEEEAEAETEAIEDEATEKTPDVVADVKEDAPVPQTTADEETLSSPETVTTTESTPETVPTPSPLTAEEKEDTAPPQTVVPSLVETTMQATIRLILFPSLIQEQVVSPPEPEPTPNPPPEPEPITASLPAPEEADLSWEDKEDKLDAENIPPDSPQTNGDKKYQYKEEQWKPINPEEKKKYDREFLLGFQFISASMNKPEGLPAISDVVLDKANKTPLRQPDSSRLPGMNCGPDFTPSFANLGRIQKEPRKIITSMSMNDDVQLNKAEKAWKPSTKKVSHTRAAEETNEESDTEQAKTQELFKRVRSILNKLTPQKFQELMKQVTELTIDTEERLKGVIDLTFEKAISEPNFSVAYANMCRCLLGLKVQTPDKPGMNFRKLLLNRCQKEFEKDKDDDEIFEKKQKELEAASEEEKQRLVEELVETKDKARRRSMGNIKFIGELFKLKMLTEVIMHDCIVKLLKNHDDESLECLCRLLSTIGKDLDFEKAKPRMDQYFNQMDKIIKERKTTSRIRFMLQDVLDLRQGPKTIDQIHKEAELEEHREQMKVQQALISKKEYGGGPGGRMGGGGPGGRGGPHSQGRGAPPQNDGWSTVTISKSRPIDNSRLTKITKAPVLDLNNQLLAPGGKGSWGSWGKGSSGGTSAKPVGGRPATSTLNRFQALQQPLSSGSSTDSDRRVPQRNSSSRERSDRFDRSGDRFDRRDDRRDDRDRNRLQLTKRSFSRENQERSRERENRGSADPVRRVASMTDDRDRSNRDRAQSKENVKRETSATPPPPQTPSKPAMTEEEVEKKTIAILEEYLHINDMSEALQCVREINSTLLFVFVRNGVESTLERSTIAREHMGLLLHQLVKTSILPIQQYYKGLHEILEMAEDMAIDIPLIWLYLAELLTPMLHEGGIPMGELFREVSKPLVPLGKAGVLLVQILNLLCKGMSHKKAGTMWRDAGLRWSDFLPEDVDVNKFVTEKNVEFTLGEESEMGRKEELSSAEITQQLDKLLQDKASNRRIFDWIEANLDEQQTTGNVFIRALITCICKSAIIRENPYELHAHQIRIRAKVLQKYLNDEQKELQGLYALQALMVQLDQPPYLLRMFFDALYDEDVVKEEAFYKWEVCKDPAEQQGKGVALKSLTTFFTWLRDADDESDNS
uniref:Eukaryotic translation initiation factor 4 gamma 1 n=1 Tax=Cynoglossus semilaevis TaxID=244447 RepID=A0A3P8V5I3_CYNSE